MGWYQRFREAALHAKPPPQPPLPPGPGRVREWWQSHVCPCSPLDYARDARERGVSFAEHVEWYFVGDYDLSLEETHAFRESQGEMMATMVAVMSGPTHRGWTGRTLMCRDAA